MEYRQGIGAGEGVEKTCKDAVHDFGFTKRCSYLCSTSNQISPRPSVLLKHVC